MFLSIRTRGWSRTTSRGRVERPTHTVLAVSRIKTHVRLGARELHSESPEARAPTHTEPTFSADWAYFGSKIVGIPAGTRTRFTWTKTRCAAITLRGHKIESSGRRAFNVTCRFPGRDPGTSADFYRSSIPDVSSRSPFNLIAGGQHFDRNPTGIRFCFKRSPLFGLFR